MNRAIVIAIATLLLAGCFATGGGGEKVIDGSAIYEWSMTTPEGNTCSTRIVSSRETAGGWVAIDGHDCSVTADAKAMSAGGLSDKLIERLIERALP